MTNGYIGASGPELTAKVFVEDSLGPAGTSHFSVLTLASRLSTCHSHLSFCFSSDSHSYSLCSHSHFHSPGLTLILTLPFRAIVSSLVSSLLSAFDGLMALPTLQHRSCSLILPHCPSRHTHTHPITCTCCYHVITKSKELKTNIYFHAYCLILPHRPSSRVNLWGSRWCSAQARARSEIISHRRFGQISPRRKHRIHWTY